MRQLLATIAATPCRQHHVICGDFNSTPANTLTFTAKCVPAMLVSGQTPLSSAYPLSAEANGYKVPFTLYARKYGFDVKLILDYIFHSQSLVPASLYHLPEAAELEHGGLPSLRYPSDHFAISAEFLIAQL